MPRLQSIDDNTEFAVFESENESRRSDVGSIITDTPVVQRALPPRRGGARGHPRGGSAHGSSAGNSHNHVTASSRSPAAVALGMMQTNGQQQHHHHNSVASEIMAGASSHHQHFGSSAAQFGHSAATTGRRFSLQPRRGGAFPQSATHSVGTNHTSNFNSNPMLPSSAAPGGDQLLIQQLGNAMMLRSWLDAHDVPAIDYVDVLVHFIRVDSTRTDVVSLAHVLVGAAQLVNAVQSSMALMSGYGVGGGGASPTASRVAPLGHNILGSRTTTHNNSPHASVTGGSVAAPPSIALSSPMMVGGGGPRSTTDDASGGGLASPTQHSFAAGAVSPHPLPPPPEYQTNQTYAVRVMLFELQTLGSVLARCQPFVKLSPTAGNLVRAFSIASFMNIAQIADGIPIAFKEVMSLIVPTSSAMSPGATTGGTTAAPRHRGLHHHSHHHSSSSHHPQSPSVGDHNNNNDGSIVVTIGGHNASGHLPPPSHHHSVVSDFGTGVLSEDPTMAAAIRDGGASNRKGNDLSCSPHLITDPRQFIPMTGAPPPCVMLAVNLSASEPLHVAVNILVSAGMCIFIVLAAIYDQRWEVEIPLTIGLVVLVSGWTIRYRYPLIGMSLKIIAMACCVIAYAVDIVLYRSVEMGSFPYWIVAVATSLFYSCRLTDVPTLRLEGNRFQSSYIVDDLLYEEDLSDEDDDDEDSNSSSSGDEAEELQQRNNNNAKRQQRRDQRRNHNDDSSGDNSSEESDGSEEDDVDGGAQETPTRRRQRRRSSGVKPLTPSKLRRLRRQQRRDYMAVLAEQYTVRYVHSFLLHIILPIIMISSVVGGFAARVALDEAFRQGASIVGEATVVMILGSVFVHHYFNAQQRRLSEDDALRLAYGIIRSTIDDIRAVTASATPTTMTMLNAAGGGAVASNGESGATGGGGGMAAGNSATGMELLAQRQQQNHHQYGGAMSSPTPQMMAQSPFVTLQNTNSATQQQQQQRVRSQSHSIGGGGGSGGSTVVSPKMKDDIGNRNFSMPLAISAGVSGGQRPSNRVMPLRDDDDMTSSVNQLMELESNAGGGGGGLDAGNNPNNMRGGVSPGRRPKSPAVYRGGGGRPQQQRSQSNAVYSSGGALVKDMSSSHSGVGLEINTPLSHLNQIILAGKNIAPHGEMLLNLPPHPVTGKYPSGGGATLNATTGCVWRTPLDEVHLTTIVVGVDGRGDIVLWNWFAEDVTQFTALDMMGRNILSILPSSEFHAEMFSKISMTMSDRSTSTTRCSIVSRRVGKPTIDVALQAYPAKSLNGTTVGVIFAGSAIRHEALQDVATQLLDIHSSMPDIPSRSQLYQSLLLLQSELPKSTVEVSLPQFLGRIFSAQFQKKAVLLDVQPHFPSTIMIDVDALQLLVLEMLQHYMRAAGNGCVHIKLGHDDVAQVVVLKATVEALAGSVRGGHPMEFGGSLGSLLRDDVPIWKPSVTVAQAARKLNCVIRTDSGSNPNNVKPVPDCHCNITIVGAVAAGGGGGGGKNGNSAANSFDNDQVRCNVAIYDSETLSSILIRNAVWERKHMLFFIEDAKKLSVALDGVDILFARFPSSLVEQVVMEIKQERPLLEMVVIASHDNESGGSNSLIANFKKLPCIIMEDPILSSEIQDALTTKVRAIADRRLREDKVSDIRKLFSQTKSCPWVRGRLLGRGATAIVYEATNTITSGKMAVRTIRINSLEPEQLKLTMESLIAEVKLMSRLEHKNIINYLSLERDPDAINVFLEYAPGGSIRSLLDKRRVSMEQSAMWLRDILEGLSYLHTEGIVHLDLKCANVLLAADNTCKISDFGTAREIDPATRQTNTNSPGGGNNSATNSLSNNGISNTTNSTTTASKESDASGTLHFMSPEMLNGGPIDWRSDIWSLGCLAMELITGKLPFAHMGALAIVGYVSSLTISDTVDLPREIHQDMNAVSFITACLCVDPAGRPNARTLQNHPFIVQQSGRQLTMPQTGAQASAAAAVNGKPSGGGRGGAGLTTESSDDEDSGRRESCFSSWSAQDQFQERRRATAADW